MKKHAELAVAIVFVALILGLTDPIDLLMPNQVQMTLLVLAVVVYGLFAGLMFKEKPADEREEQLRNQSSRIGFLVGTSVLVVGVIMQTLNHNLDNWLIWSLGGMVVAKVLWSYKTR